MFLGSLREVINAPDRLQRSSMHILRSAIPEFINQRAPVSPRRQGLRQQLV